MQISRALRLRPGDVVSLVGGGGKTAIMFRLAEEVVATGRPVITTMTTHIFASQAERAPASLLVDGDRPDLSALEMLSAAQRHVLMIGAGEVVDQRAPGVARGAVDAVAGLPGIGAVIVEADGSRRLPFKAPAGHEPVVPESTTVLAPVFGLDAVGQPLDGAHVHRPELVAALAGVGVGTDVTPEVVARVLAHPEGGAKGLPEAARLVPFLNKADLPGRREMGRQIARLLLDWGIVDSVVIGAAETAEPVLEVWTRTGAVVLAAGQGKRFGALKQALPWGDGTLVAHVTKRALACPDVGPVAVTVGAQMEVTTAALARGVGADVRAGRWAKAGPLLRAGIVATVDCGPDCELMLAPVPDWELGQSRSVRAGLNAVDAWGALSRQGHGGLGAAVFLLADQPGVSPGLLSALVQRHRETLAPVVAPRYEGRRGNPVLFDASTFGEFAALAGDVGARPVLQAHEADIAWVDWPGAEIVQDIDLPGDYPVDAERN